MTERFICDDAGSLIDLENMKYYDIVEEVCPVLNALHEENIQLKKEFGSCSHNWSIMYDEAKNKVEELHKENTILKREYNTLLQLVLDSGIDYSVSDELEELE